MNVVRRKPWLATRLIKERGPGFHRGERLRHLLRWRLVATEVGAAWAHSWQNSSAKGRSRMTARGRRVYASGALTRFLSWRNDMDSPVGLVAKGQAGNFDFPAIFAHFRPFRVGWEGWGRVHRNVDRNNVSRVYRGAGKGQVSGLFLNRARRGQTNFKKTLWSLRALWLTVAF